MTKASLWLVEIDEADWDYDRFEKAAVWAESAEEAEAIMRAETWAEAERPWIESESWRLNVQPAPTEGVALVHWHAG